MHRIWVHMVPPCMPSLRHRPLRRSPMTSFPFLLASSPSWPAVIYSAPLSASRVLLIVSKRDPGNRPGYSEFLCLYGIHRRRCCSVRQCSRLIVNVVEIVTHMCAGGSCHVMLYRMPWWRLAERASIATLSHVLCSRVISWGSKSSTSFSCVCWLLSEERLLQPKVVKGADPQEDSQLRG